MDTIVKDTETVKYTLVYRIEDKYGCGPYNSPHHKKMQEIMYSWMCFIGMKFGVCLPAWEHDIPKFDKLTNFLEYYSGIEKPEQIKLWFLGVFDDLKKYNFHIVVYKVPAKDVIKGKSKLQVIFKKDKAIKVKTLDYSEL